MSSKIGLLSDIHGNFFALKAVLDKAKKEKITDFIFCGDLVGYYYEPKKCLELLSSFKVEFIKGNHEIMMDDFLKKKISQESIIKKYGHGLQNAVDQLSKEQIEFLLSLNHTKTIKIKNKLVNISHGSPWSPFDYIYKNSSDETFKKFSNRKEDIFIFGNTHHQMKTTKYSKIMINPGSVGQPRDNRGVASWATLDQDNFEVDFFSEKYDKHHLLEQIKRIEKENKNNYKALI